MKNPQSLLTIRAVQQADNVQIAKVIRDVMTEFSAVGEGYSINDSEVDDMYSAYADARSCYFVIVGNEKVIGGGGIGPLAGADQSVCELRKMFFLPEARGLGMGRRLLLQLMDEARSRNFKTCYLETLDRMEAATSLYLKNGFKLLDGAMGNTGHCSCDSWYSLDLEK